MMTKVEGTHTHKHTDTSMYNGLRERKHIKELMFKQKNKIEMKGNSKENDKDHRKVGKIQHMKTMAIKQNTKTTIQNTF